MTVVGTIGSEILGFLGFVFLGFLLVVQFIYLSLKELYDRL